MEEKQEIYNANPEVTKNVRVVEESNETEPKNKEVPKVENKTKDDKEKILSFEEMYKELFGKEPYGGRKQPEEEEKDDEAGF